MFLYDILNGLSRRVYGVWDKRYGWLTHSGRVIVSRNPEKLEPLSDVYGDKSTIRRFVGFVRIDETDASEPGRQIDPYWRLENE